MKLLDRWRGGGKRGAAPAPTTPRIGAGDSPRVKLEKPKRRSLLKRLRAWEPTSGGSIRVKGSGERPNLELVGKLHKLRMKCRTLVTSTAQGEAYVRYSVDSIITRRGFVPDYGSDADSGLREEINAAWIEWARGDCSLDGSLNFADVCEMAVRSYLIDGESFVRMHPKAGGLRLEVIDPFRVPTFRRANNSVMGVVLDANGCPEAFLIRDLDQFADPTSETVQEVPVDFVMHWANTSYPNQVRGTPPITAATEAMKALDDFRQYALEAARINAGYIGTLKEQEAFVPFEGDRNEDDEDDSEETVQVLDTDAMRLFQPPKGYSIDPFPGQFPDQVTGTFMSAMARQVATGLGLAAHNLDGDFSGINYSAGRMAEMGQRMHFDRLRETFIRRTLAPVYLYWLKQHGFPEKLPTWAQADRPQIDPSKEASTLTALVNARIISRREAMQQLGHDPEAMLAQIEEEKELEPSATTGANNPDEDNPFGEVEESPEDE